MALSKQVARALTTIFLSGAMAISQVAPAQAFFFLLDPDVRDRIEFFASCKELMLTNPAQHVKICNPSLNVVNYEPQVGAGVDRELPQAPTTMMPSYDYCSGGCDQEAR